MTVAELIKELQRYKPEAEVVAVGACRSFTGDGPDFFEADPFITDEKDGMKVIIQA